MTSTRPYRCRRPPADPRLPLAWRGVVVAVGLCVGLATAAPVEARTPAGGAAAPAQPANAADRLRRAEAMATEAKALFKNQVYDDAARLFMEAYAVSKRAPLVYNAARAYEEAGRLKRAESLFLLYKTLPDADPAGLRDAAEHLAAVRRRIEAGEARDEPEPSGADGGSASAAGSAAAAPSATSTPPSPPAVRQALPPSR